MAEMYADLLLCTDAISFYNFKIYVNTYCSTFVSVLRRKTIRKSAKLCGQEFDLEKMQRKMCDIFRQIKKLLVQQRSHRAIWLLFYFIGVYVCELHKFVCCSASITLLPGPATG
jgi:hypothetical protein